MEEKSVMTEIMSRDKIQIHVQKYSLCKMNKIICVVRWLRIEFMNKLDHLTVNCANNGMSLQD